jgi:hypothetical protein
MSVKLKPADRRYFIGGSDARVVMGDDEAALIRLWREKRGEIEPQDLSGNLIVQLGLVTEPLNRHWYERNSGQILTGVQRRVHHPVVRWMAATLDGSVTGISPSMTSTRRVVATPTLDAAAKSRLSIAAWRAPRVWALEILPPLLWASDGAPQPAFRFFGLAPLLSGSMSRICNMAVVRRRMDSARDGRSGCLRRHSSRRFKNSLESRI